MLCKTSVDGSATVRSWRRSKAWAHLEAMVQKMNSLRFRLPTIFGVLAVVLAGLPGNALALRGYQSRPCGFDLNHNGIVGEPADCTICSTSDGNLTVGGSTYTQVYVDCQNGNNANAGTRAAPKKTITSALTVKPTSGASLAVCFKGTCSPSSGETFPLVPVAGISGSYTRIVSSSDPAPFSFPTKPAMIVGWDANGDGDYPPHSGETAALDGASSAAGYRAIDNTGGASYLEYAHFTAQDFGIAASTNERGFFFLDHGASAAVNNIYVHDLQLSRILKGQLNTSSDIVFPFWVGGGGMNNIALININATEFGSYFARGQGGTPSVNSTNWRLQNISATAYGETTRQNTSAVIVMKLWGWNTGVDVLDNHFDAQPTAWNAGSVQYPTSAVMVMHCSNNWTIRNNDIIDWRHAITLQPGNPSDPTSCLTRAIDNIAVDRNDFVNSFPWLYQQLIQFGSGSSLTNTVNTVTLTNNFIAQLGAAQANGTFLWSDTGNAQSEQPGSVTIAGNTFYGDVNVPAVIIGAYFAGYSLPAYPQQNYIIKDNVIAGLRSGDLNIWTQYAPTNWQADYNVFQNDPSGGRFVWTNSSATSFANWKSQSGGDAHSFASCTPSFVNTVAGNLHLNSTDTCAKDVGTALSGVTSVDYDGETRPVGAGWDIGADEYSLADAGLASPTLIQVVVAPGP